MTTKINIAIDGPAGAGKSTVARMVAGKLGYVYVDTGAMYRAVTWKLLRQGLTTDQTEAIDELLQMTEIELSPGAEGQIVKVDQQDVTSELRTPEISNLVARTAQIPQVRNKLTELQKQLALHKGIVMDGRDIGTSVLPNAELKVFLTASVEERAMRRYKEFQASEPNMKLDALMRDIADRDQLDQERAISPLIQAEDAVYIDSTKQSIEEVVDHIVQLSLNIIAREH